MKFFTEHPKITTAAIVLYASLFFLTSIPLAASDLGRHIMNGKLVWLTAGSQIFGEQVFDQATQDGVGTGTAAEWKSALEHSVLTTNAYSFTHPEFPVINHHWLFGLLAYGVFLSGGFQLLTLMNVVVVGGAIACILIAARQRTNWGGVWAAAALLLPLVTDRTEVRPESFSLLFSALIFLILTRFTNQKLSFPLTLLSIVIVQFFWVNIHVFFVLGLGIIGVFWLESLIGTRKLLPQLTGIGILAALTSLLNPNGRAGALAPFNIFENYDFLVAENQSTFFMLRILPHAEHWYYLFALASVLIFTLLAVQLSRNHSFSISRQLLTWKNALPWVLYVLILGIVGSQINRFYSFFALLSLPPLTCLFSYVLPKISVFCKRVYENAYALPFASLALFIMIGGLVASGLFIPNPARLYTGTLPDTATSAAFFAAYPPEGKIFNNYDIGGYLIFYLFPHHRVYTDNRPEAYPSGFFENYRAIQIDFEAWDSYAHSNGITAIFFNRNDLTDHGQKFLIERIRDPEWAPIFVDLNTLLLYKRIPAHDDIIKKYELPPEIFAFTESE